MCLRSLLYPFYDFFFKKNKYIKHGVLGGTDDKAKFTILESPTVESSFLWVRKMRTL